MSGQVQQSSLTCTSRLFPKAGACANMTDLFESVWLLPMYKHYKETSIVKHLTVILKIRFDYNTKCQMMSPLKIETSAYMMRSVDDEA